MGFIKVGDPQPIKAVYDTKKEGAVLCDVCNAPLAVIAFDENDVADPQCLCQTDME